MAYDMKDGNTTVHKRKDVKEESLIPRPCFV